MFLLLLTVFFAAGYGQFSTPQYGGRNVTKTLLVTNGGRWGYWGNPEYCPVGTFASGYSMKIESDQFAGDDTALNAIRLTCADTTGRPYGSPITSTEGPFGSYSQTEHCNQPFGSASFLTSFQLQVEGDQGGSDDTSANYIKFHCRNFAGNNPETELVLPPGRGIWGNYGNWSASCDPGSAICGLNTKVEEVQNDGDDTSLNDVVFYCCNDANINPMFG